MVARAEFKIKGINTLARNMLHISKKLKNQRATNHKAVILIDRWVQKNFQQEGKMATHGGWEPLLAATIKRRRIGPKAKTKGRKVRILQDTGQLRSRWEHYYTQRMGKVTSAVDYGIYHDEGWGHLPERAIIPTEAQMMPELLKLFRKHIQTSLQ